jgi:tryptophanyl-tRNA synthetase
VRNEDLSFSVWLEGECRGDSPAFADACAGCGHRSLRVALPRFRTNQRRGPTKG